MEAYWFEESPHVTALLSFKVYYQNNTTVDMLPEIKKQIMTFCINRPDDFVII
jgi:hypothetical protein